MRLSKYSEFTNEFTKKNAIGPPVTNKVIDNLDIYTFIFKNFDDYSNTCTYILFLFLKPLFGGWITFFVKFH